MARKAATGPQKDTPHRKSPLVELSKVPAPDREAQDERAMEITAAVGSFLQEQRGMSAELQRESPGQEEFTTKKKRHVEGVCADASINSLISRTEKKVTKGRRKAMR